MAKAAGAYRFDGARSEPHRRVKIRIEQQDGRRKNAHGVGAAAFAVLVHIAVRKRCQR